MAAIVQKNGMKPLQITGMVNGNLQHLDVNNIKLEGECIVNKECLNTNEETQPAGLYMNHNTINREFSSENDGYTLYNENSGVSERVDTKYGSGNNEPEVDIVINNVVCSFSVRCHLNLRQIALNGVNVEYRRENGMVTMKLRKPYTTASIWSSGKITCTGATSEHHSHMAARRFARCLQKLGFRTRFTNYRVVNVLGTCSMPFAIKITSFSEKYKEFAEYEPELHPGVTYKLKKPKATLKIFSTGSITVTAPSVADVQEAIEQIYPLVHEFKTDRSKEDEYNLEKRRAKSRKRKYSDSFNVYGGTDEEEEEEDEGEVALIKEEAIKQEIDAEDWI